MSIPFAKYYPQTIVIQINADFRVMDRVTNRTLATFGSAEEACRFAEPDERGCQCGEPDCASVQR